MSEGSTTGSTARRARSQLPVYRQRLSSRHGQRHPRGRPRRSQRGRAGLHRRGVRSPCRRSHIGVRQRLPHRRRCVGGPAAAQREAPTPRPASRPVVRHCPRGPSRDWEVPLRDHGDPQKDRSPQRHGDRSTFETHGDAWHQEGPVPGPAPRYRWSDDRRDRRAQRRRSLRQGSRHTAAHVTGAPATAGDARPAVELPQQDPRGGRTRGQQSLPVPTRR